MEMLDHDQEYSLSSMDGDHDQDFELYSGCMEMDDSAVNMMRKKRNKMNKRRFSDEQIKSLESIFENESRLEPRKKMLLARELGLQPRQVAIWFQNKRARWKSKQIEKDYSNLQANYNSLATRYETLKKEKQSLVMQLQHLRERLGKPEEDSHVQSKAENSTDSAHSYNGDPPPVTCEAGGVMKSRLSEETEVEHGRLSGSVSDCDRKIKSEYFSLEEGSDLLDLMDPGEGSMTSTEDWDKFETDGLLEQSGSGSSPWWDFWS